MSPSGLATNHFEETHSLSWPKKCQPIIERYGIDGFCEAARIYATHECFASIFTFSELLQIETHLKERFKKP